MRSKRSRIAGWIFGLVLGLASGRAWAWSPEPEGIVVDVEPTVPDAELAHQWVVERAVRVLDETEGTLRAGDSLRIKIDGTLYDYRIAVILTRNERELSAEQQPSVVSCACDSDERLTRVDEAVSSGVDRLLEMDALERRASLAARQARARARRLELEQEPQRQVEDARYRPTALGGTGLGFLVFGAGVSVMGGIAMGWNASADVPGQTVAVRPKWPGQALVGVGVTAVAGGATMLIIDAARCRRDRTRCVDSVARNKAAARWAGRRRARGL